MKTMTIKRFWAFCLCSMPFFIAAQNKHAGYDRVKAIKMSFIVEKSTLSPDEESVFWPIYDEYEDLIHKKIRRESYALKKSYKNQLPSISDGDAEIILKKMDSMEQLKLDQTRLRNEVLMAKLGAAKVLSILYSEQLFNKEMFHRSRNKSKEITKKKY